ncbi:hypothetical protein BT63DRAFT_444318 [Microthyrium microscopicum]|uniref:Uncharacterized protein n=1 Tax=Microthyrium microscopicum TaxID=703497 RepID=A0A6A6TVT9_9PEZI|nr:hypothetical protein BT63DRAFT_444318 [Microthyrium microscopicum]
MEWVNDVAANVQSFAEEQGENIAKGTSGAAQGAQIIADEQGSNIANGASDATAGVQGFVEDIGAQIAKLVTDIVTAGKALADEQGPRIVETTAKAAEELAKVADEVLDWIMENPDVVAIGAAGLIIMIAPGLVSTPLLSLAGFTPLGIAAGSVAAAAQVPVTSSNSMFAILQSAGAGGDGLAIVNGAIQVTAALGTAALIALIVTEREKRKNSKTEKQCIRRSPKGTKVW